MSTTPEATSHHSSRKFSIHLPLSAIQNLSFHYETPCNMCIINMKNVEPLIFGDAFLNFVRFETFAQTPFFDFGHFQRIFTTDRNHFTCSWNFQANHQIKDTIDSRSHTQKRQVKTDKMALLYYVYKIFKNCNINFKQHLQK